MPEAVNGRRYHAPRRVARAARTRTAVLTAARTLFLERGYAAATIAEIARAAGVAVDTVYTSVGRKPDILRELVETAISGTGQAVPAAERAYVADVHAAVSALEKIRVYAHAVAEVLTRLAPVVAVLRDAAASDPDCRELWQGIASRRAVNMRAFVAELRTAGGVRADLDDDRLADVVWSMNAPEYWTLLVTERGWTSEEFAAWLTDAWCRLLLDRP